MSEHKPLEVGGAVESIKPIILEIAVLFSHPEKAALLLNQALTPADTIQTATGEMTLADILASIKISRDSRVQRGLATSESLISLETLKNFLTGTEATSRLGAMEQSFNESSASHKLQPAGGRLGIRPKSSRVPAAPSLDRLDEDTDLPEADAPDEDDG